MRAHESGLTRATAADLKKHVKFEYYLSLMLFLLVPYLSTLI